MSSHVLKRIPCLIHRWKATLFKRKFAVIQHSSFRYDLERCKTDEIYYCEMRNALRVFLIYLIGCGELDVQMIIDYYRDEFNRY